MQIWHLKGMVALALVGSIALTGCGQPSPTKINGKVTLDGQPLEGVDLQVMPISSNAALFAGLSGADGAFSISVLPGAKFEPGTYKVTASKYVAKGDTKGLGGTPGMDVTQLKAMGLAQNMLPPIYELPQQTPIKVELTLQTTSIDVPLRSK